MLKQLSKVSWPCLILLLCNIAVSQQAAPPNTDWLRGNGESLEIRLRGEIVDDEGKPVIGAKLVDSAGPLGNIGAPSGFDAEKHLKTTLNSTRTRLTDEEIEKLLKSLSK